MAEGEAGACPAWRSVTRRNPPPAPTPTEADPELSWPTDLVARSSSSSSHASSILCLLARGEARECGRGPGAMWRGRDPDPMAGMPGRHLLSRMLGLRRWRCASPRSPPPPAGPQGGFTICPFGNIATRKKPAKCFVISMNFPHNERTTRQREFYNANYNCNHGSARDERELERTVALIAD